AQYLKDLKNVPTTAKRQGRNARKLLEENFTRDIMVKNYKTVLLDIIKQQRMQSSKQVKERAISR
ncbi:MAG: hypothetical protein AAGB01_07835, partial [Cyanobacteria bacterium P01_F01_bin.42]